MWGIFSFEIPLMIEKKVSLNSDGLLILDMRMIGYPISECNFSRSCQLGHPTQTELIHIPYLMYLQEDSFQDEYKMILCWTWIEHHSSPWAKEKLSRWNMNNITNFKIITISSGFFKMEVVSLTKSPKPRRPNPKPTRDKMKIHMGGRLSTKLLAFNTGTHSVQTILLIGKSWMVWLKGMFLLLVYPLTFTVSYHIWYRFHPFVIVVKGI